VTPDPTISNPFSMVLGALWGALESHPHFTRDVAEGNRIKFDDSNDRSPMKATIAAGDLPEIVILPEDLQGNLQDSSSSTKCVRQYAIFISTGDYRYNEFLARIEWEVFVGLLSWKTRLATLTWKKAHFVKNVNIVSASSGLSDPERNRNLRGWSAAWRVRVEMHFSTAALQGELTAKDQVN